MECDYVEQAVQLVQEAVKLDENMESRMALRKYIQALNYFELELKHGSRMQIKDTIRVRMCDYLERAEQLQRQLKKEGKLNTTVPLKTKQKQPVEKSESNALQNAIETTILTEKPNVTFQDVAGLVEAKQSLTEAVLLPLKAPQLFDSDASTWSGILLYGPPGTGKSHLAKAVATESGATFFSLSASNLVSKWVGESEKLIRELFVMARERKPSVIFIDELEALLPSRSQSGSNAQHGNRVVGELLSQLDGVGKDSKGILFLGATNLPWTIDSAILRPGRFDRKIYIPLPDGEARCKMFEIHANKTKKVLSIEQCQELASLTDGFSGSDIAGIVKQAQMRPLRKVQQATHFKVENGIAYPIEDESDPNAECAVWTDFDPRSLGKPKLEYADFQEALKEAKASVDPATLQQYQEWTRQFGLQ